MGGLRVEKFPVMRLMLAVTRCAVPRGPRAVRAAMALLYDLTAFQVV